MAYRYPTIKVNGMTKLRHRHMMEEYLGRKLRPDEYVHRRKGEAPPVAAAVMRAQFAVQAGEVTAA